MMKRTCLAVLLAIALTFTFGTTNRATSCPPHDPSAILTPDCTFIVAQYDPGVLLDNLGSYWVFVSGQIFPVNVGKDPSVLKIGKK